MEALSWTASALNYALNKAAAGIQLLFSLNHNCVSFFLWFLSTVSDIIVSFGNNVVTVLHCCISDFISFLDEFGLTLYFTGLFVGEVGCRALTCLSQVVALGAKNISELYLIVYNLILTVINGIELGLETLHYVIRLLLSAILLILQGIPNGFLLVVDALVFVVLGFVSLGKLILCSILKIIFNCRVVLIEAMFNTPVKAYIGLFILIFMYYQRNFIVMYVKLLFCLVAVCLLNLYMKFLDSISLTARKVWYTTSRVLRRNVVREPLHSTPQRPTESALSFKTLLRGFKRNATATHCENNSGDLHVLQRELLREKDRRMCIICQDQERNVILLPCRHLCMCEGCCQSLRESYSGCPLCRKYILDTIYVYT